MKSMIDGKLKLSHVMLFVVGGVAFVLVMYGVVAGVDWKTQLRPDSAMAQRILVGNVEAVFASFELFPHRVESDDLYLVGIPSPILSFFGKTVTPSKRLLMEYLRPDGVERGTAGYLVGYYLAEAWANYGVAGLLLAPAIVGLWVQLCHAWFLRRRKTPLAIAVYAHLATSWEAHGEFVGFLYLKPVILTVILAGTLVLLINAAHKSFWSTARVRLGL